MRPEFANKTEQLKKLIIENIKSGYFQSGGKIFTELEWAERYPLSRIIAQSALTELMTLGIISRSRGRGSFVSKDALEIIRQLEKAEKVTAPQLKVGFVFREKWFTSSVYRQVYELFSRFCAPGVATVVYFHNYLKKEIYKKDGIKVLIIDKYFLDEDVEVIDDPEVEKVVLFRESPIYNYLSPDNYLGGYLAGQYLAGQGHRQIAGFQFREANEVEFNERSKGLQDGAQKLGAELVWVSLASFQETHNLRGAIDFLFSKGRNFTAIAGLSDAMALNICEILDDMGLAVPDEISVMGYDDVFFSSRLRVPLTTIRQPFGAIIRRLTDGLEEYLHTGKLKLAEKLAPMLVERESVKSLR
jgi:DNA-binding LacI/PurR family transcriptional regulator/DNA-binding transcriptional regulator YhcF (GntR family)